MSRIVVQRVSVWWGGENRGAGAARLRRDLPEDFPPPAGEGCLLHCVAMWDHKGYRPEESVRAPRRGSDPWGLRMGERDGRLSVARTSVSDAFPRRWPRPLFDLAPGEAGLYRANFRFVALSHESRWWYSDWTLRVGFGVQAVWPEPVRRIDDRVSLYGGGG